MFEGWNEVHGPDNLIRVDEPKGIRLVAFVERYRRVAEGAES